MTLILGLDIATTTGWALYSTRDSLATIRTGVFIAKGETALQKGADLGVQVMWFLKDLKVRQSLPVFAMMEQPLQVAVQHKKKVHNGLFNQEAETTINPATVILANTLCGAVATALHAYKIPFETIAVQSWRKFFYPKGLTPPMKETKHRNGSSTFAKDWKQAAINRCREMRVDVVKHDAAEAAGIAIAAASTPTFKMIEHQAHQGKVA